MTSTTKSSSGKSKTKEGKSKSKYEIAKLKDLENQLVLRMPEPYASTLREALTNGGLKDRLQIDFEDDARHATVKFDKVVFAAQLYDLPCVVESWKTFDKKSIWKTGDICQVLICKDPEGPDSSSEDEENTSMDYIKRKLQETKKYQYAHGLTPPLKNVRKRRFRKTAKQKYIDAPEIEKEVKRLLRADVSAVDVKFEIVNDELEKQRKLQLEEAKEGEIDVGGPSLVPSIVENFNENSNFSTFSEEQEAAAPSLNILPDISSSEDEETNHRQTLEEQLSQIDTRIKSQQHRVEKAANPFLKQRFQKELDSLNAESEKTNLELQALNIN